MYKQKITRLSLGRQFKDHARVLFYLATAMLLIWFCKMIPDHDAARAAMIGGLTGLFVHMWLSAPAKMLVDGKASTWESLVYALSRLGYVEVSDDRGNASFLPKTPVWMTFKSQAVTVLHAARSWEIVGPHYVLKSLGKRFALSDK